MIEIRIFPKVQQNFPIDEYQGTNGLKTYLTEVTTNATLAKSV